MTAHFLQRTVGLGCLALVLCVLQCGSKRERLSAGEHQGSGLCWAQDSASVDRPGTVGPERTVISIAAVGDVMMGGAALQAIQERGCDYPFDSTRAILQAADLAISNL